MFCACAVAAQAQDRRTLDNELLTTVKKSDLSRVRQLIAEGADVRGTNLVAVVAPPGSYPDAVQSDVAHGARVDLKNDRGQTAYHIAVVNRSVKLAQYLKSVGG
jgi:ankyrin repeat protein